MYKLNTIEELIELANYLKNSFKFVLMDSGFQSELRVTWNIQDLNLGEFFGKKNDYDTRIILEIVIFQDTFALDNYDAESIITNLQKKFEILEESFYELISDTGENIIITKMQDDFKKRYELVGGKNIPSEFKNFKVTISIESLFHHISPNAKSILIDEDLKKNEIKFVKELARQSKYLDNIKEYLVKSNRPLIVTEGKTDLQHIKKAKEKLELNKIDVDFYEISESFGDKTLKGLLEGWSKIPQPRRPVIGIFDRDNPTIVAEMEGNGASFKDFGNNVFAFCIPIENESVYGKQISIEHYYPKHLLLKKDSNNRRLFLGEEFFESGNSRDGRYRTRMLDKVKNKVKVNGIIDDKVFCSNDLEHKDSIALTKAAFANLIEKDADFLGDFDFKSFVSLFNRINDILELIRKNKPY